MKVKIQKRQTCLEIMRDQDPTCSCICFTWTYNVDNTDRFFQRGGSDAALKETLTPHVFGMYRVLSILPQLLASEHLVCKNLRLYLKGNSFDCRYCGTKQILVIECRENRKINSPSQDLLLCRIIFLNDIISAKQCHSLFLYSPPSTPKT